MVIAVDMGEDALLLTLPSTLRRRYRLLESSTWRSQAQPSLGVRMLHLWAMMLHHHPHYCLM